ncbi:hypothetical protein DV735_g2138, partial [Chaetothyriales sp. CBS 134920]
MSVASLPADTMNTFEIPSSGLRLAHAPADKAVAAPHPGPVLRLHLVQEETREIIHFLKSGRPVQLQTGRQPAIQYGDHKLKLQNAPDTFPSEIYLRPKGAGDMLYFAGKLSHTLEIQQARQDTAKADDALAALQSSLKSLKEEKAMNETSFVNSREDMKMVGKDRRASPLLGGRKDLLHPRSIPGSPYPNAINSPRAGLTSAPLMPNSSKDKIRIEAIKIPMIHLLAMRPMTAKEVADSLRAPKDDVDRLLEKHAPTTTASGKKELRDRSYRDLDVWKFPYPKDEDRQAAIDRAISAFDRMRVDQSDVVWQLLLPKKERGKGKVLSKLRIDNQPAKPRPKAADKSETSDAEPKTARKGPEKRKAEGENDGPQKKAKPSTTAVKKKQEAKASRGPAADSKVKSSEKIEDSDEEASLVPVAPAKKAPSPAKKAPSPAKKAPSPAKKSQVQSGSAPASPSVNQRKASPAARKPQHKTALSTSSSSGDNSDTHAMRHSRNQPAIELGSAKQSPRPRNGSSPQKPSPLGSSPPTNSTDTDSSSTDKAASQSSAPTSPPSSTDIPIAKQKSRYSPINTNSQRDVSRGRSAVKRVAEEAESSRPPKKQQMNGIHSSKVDKPPLKRKISDSGQSSGSDKTGPGRQVVMDEAKRFQRYYKKYKDAYDKLSKEPEKERDDKEVDDLIRMHKRLSEMKSDIWDNWNKIEKASA